MARRRKKIKRAFKIRGLFSFIISPVIKISQLTLRSITRNLHIIILAVILIFVAKGIYNIFLISDYFTVKEVQMLRIEGGIPVFDSSVSLQLEEGVNIFKLSLKKCQRRIEEAHPEIKDVKVNRVFPNKIAVFFQKRIPICQVKSTGYYLVSKDAVVLPNPQEYAQADLITVTGIYISESRLPPNRKLNSSPVQRALQLIQQIKQTNFGKKYKVEQIDVYDEFNPIIRLENGIQIKIGRDSFIKMEPVLNKVLEDLESKGLRPKSVDLRFDDVIVTPM